mgnify:CR=1 FL=1
MNHFQIYLNRENRQLLYKQHLRCNLPQYANIHCLYLHLKQGKRDMDSCRDIVLLFAVCIALNTSSRYIPRSCNRFRACTDHMTDLSSHNLCNASIFNSGKLVTSSVYGVFDLCIYSQLIRNHSLQLYCSISR